MEDPEVLRQRQQLQQSKSVHELSKIGNLNQIPLPFKLPLPDIPLPKPTKLLRVFSKKSAKPKDVKPATTTDPYEELPTGSSSPISHDRTEEELLRFDHLKS